MSSTPKIDDTLRQVVLSRPDVILDDADMMNALVAANERSMGANIVDLRGIAMERMENRLDRLEDTHRSVIAAAYDNLAGTNQIHRAVLRMLEQPHFDGFLHDLGGELAEILRIDAIKLVLESDRKRLDPAFEGLSDVLAIADPGYVAQYLQHTGTGTARQITLRQTGQTSALYGTESAQIGSEACLLLDLGPEQLPGLLVLGATDPQVFGPHQGTDLLVFFAGVVERVLRRWLP